jgi:hypothetical protein
MPTGRLWPIDSHGHIQNDANPASIHPPFAAAVADAVQAYTDHISADIDSIYVTGSVARGLAVAGVSDLNMFTVLDATVDPDLVFQDWVEEAEEALLDQHPCLSDVQLELWPYYYVFNDPAQFSIGGFILKTHSVCMWGSDLWTQLPDYRISLAIANDDLVQIGDDIDGAVEEIKADSSASSVGYWARGAAKHMLRAGFGLVQVEAGVHTRDIDLCCDYFVRYYPDRAEAMQQVLDYARQPPDDSVMALGWLESVKSWLLPLVEAWLNEHNPTRDIALSVDDLEEIEE